MSKILEVKEGHKLTDTTKTPYYVSGFTYDRGLLDIRKKIDKCKISRISDNKYMGDFDYKNVLRNLNDGSWQTLE